MRYSAGLNRRETLMRLVTLMLLTIVVGCSGEGAPATKIELERETPMSNKAAADAFMQSNAAKPDVIQTESGLQYTIINSGAGSTPVHSDTVAAHYAGRLLDGSEFDSSYSRGEPLTIPVGGVIKGWTEALLMMKEGDKWTLFIPPELGYGERGAGPIPANSALIFDIELVEVK
ncbi:MAG: FKBP-type peptidyl-prolyl cis-trans isomerase [Candidatus Azotimanducaceae bacterium]|jgi:FKBP-type peptidyl-prolyl cis-trans isomerase